MIVPAMAAVELARGHQPNPLATLSVTIEPASAFGRCPSWIWSWARNGRTCNARTPERRSTTIGRNFRRKRGWASQSFRRESRQLADLHDAGPRTPGNEQSPKCRQVDGERPRRFSSVRCSGSCGGEPAGPSFEVPSLARAVPAMLGAR